MQRNIFGHAIYQAIVLVVIIFTAPGWLCEPYWNRCIGDTGLQPDGTDSCAYNPFYTDGLYYMDKNSESHGSEGGEANDPVYVEWWADKAQGVYDQEALRRFSCSMVVEDSTLNYGRVWGQSIDQCLEEKGENLQLRTPAEMEPYTETQQIIHYTLVFQIFVFMQIFNQINARLLEDG